jgi:hypothetical protein
MRRMAAVALGEAVRELENEAGRALGADYVNITPADVPLEILSGPGGGLRSFLTQTRFEAGRYVDPQTFVAVQATGRFPGVRLEHRRPDGLRFEFTTEQRILLREPTLSGQQFVRRRAFGGFVILQRRF